MKWYNASEQTYTRRMTALGFYELKQAAKRMLPRHVADSCRYLCHSLRYAAFRRINRKYAKLRMGGGGAILLISRV